MHHRAKDITGLKCGYLTAVKYVGSDGKKSLWKCVCSGCGGNCVIAASELKKMARKGVTASCGCMKRSTIAKKRKTHGMSQHPAFAVWSSMLARCARANHPAWHNYGGRGVKVCERWAKFEAFWEDMGESYERGLTLDRTDNNKGYSPENCRWVGRKTQARNTRKNVLVDNPMGRMTIAELSDRTGINKTTLYYRHNAGVKGSDLLLPANVKNRFTTS